MTPKMFVFDLDGTLLNCRKEISPPTIRALREMADYGALIVLASGRISNSIKQYLPVLDIDAAVLSLNGAVVCMNKAHNERCVHRSILGQIYSDYLIQFASNKPFATNIYVDDTLYTFDTKLARYWTDLYSLQTKTQYIFLTSYDKFQNIAPSKISFIGEINELDRLEMDFRAKWDHRQVYICRTWEHYLEFLNPDANKGDALCKLAQAYGIGMSDVVAFGDGENDLPMLQRAGTSIAMLNGRENVKMSSKRVTQYTNDEDGIAHEWERIKQELL
ncbi:hydrolase (HAD superfamily) [Chitinispirillum alkaliphilum]|nr:hydrolase (HAD superfamily) [Chitinispirillum alkaliphilum]